MQKANAVPPTLHVRLNWLFLRLKELIPVVLTPIDKDDQEQGFKTGIYQCPLANKTLKNGQKIGLLRPSGNVLLKSCIDKFVIPEQKDPITGVKVTKDDIIWLVTAGEFA